MAHQFSDQRRGSRQERGYGAAWDRARVRILARDGGLCQPCLADGKVHSGTEVDHIVPKANGGTDDDANLQTICRSRHQAKTAAEAAQARGATLRPSSACRADGMPTDPSHPWHKGEGGQISAAPRRRTDRKSVV